MTNDANCIAFVTMMVMLNGYKYPTRTFTSALDGYLGL
eukprot:CAMPEP_0185752774 /NCGR_PEP_ID=MMETSP1174-20130828/11553_1 /TAXON_ID=35687 /ORGANISM="Dictyocha speculum, Strain CCMP1381" /LENGTH=37 /DNA_ID= /DNA_START= /DNA_END= /DNA_ORIENTATION=